MGTGPALPPPPLLPGVRVCCCCGLDILGSEGTGGGAHH